MCAYRSGVRTASVTFVCGVIVVSLSVVFITFSILKVCDSTNAMPYFNIG